MQEVKTIFHGRVSDKTLKLPASSDPIDFSNVEFYYDVNFGGYLFTRVANFRGAKFARQLSLVGATFCEDADFGGKTVFSRSAYFSRAAFLKGAFYDGATFSQSAEFQYAIFSGIARFNGASFTKRPFSFDDAANFDHVAFSGPADFGGAAFSGQADFRGAAFSGQADFRGAAFSGPADFGSAAFSGQADFDGAAFSEWADFDGAAFSGRANFEATFGKTTSFVNAEMKGETSFEGAWFKTEPPRFSGAKLHQGTIWRGITWPSGPKDKKQAGHFMDAYACLKLEMDRLKKHEDELNFFALERQSRRVEQGFWRGLPLASYELLSDYGRSYVRPLVALLVVAIIGATAFWYFDARSIWEALGISAGNTLNIFGFRKDFGLTLDDTPLAWLKVLAALQTILGTVLLFLFGLGIRNIFRMK